MEGEESLALVLSSKNLNWNFDLKYLREMLANPEEFLSRMLQLSLNKSFVVHHQLKELHIFILIFKR